MRKRFIEWNIPLSDISEHSAIEKSVRHGHPSTLHIWWARRPLAASRVTNLAALINLPDDKERKKEIFSIFKDILPWDVVKDGSNRGVIKAQELLNNEWPDSPPLVLDPFTGGGSIPLEAQRLGCKIYANDLNPVAVFIQHATLKWPHLVPIFKEKNKEIVFKKKGKNFIQDKVKFWAEKIGTQAKIEIGQFYPNDLDGWIPNGYLWARTIPCSNISCGAEIPLIRQFLLAKKKDRLIVYKPIINMKNKIITFKIQKNDEIDFDPLEGTVKRGNARCLICNQITRADTTRRLAYEGKMSYRLIAIVLHHPDKKGKRYRLANDRDVEVYEKSMNFLTEKIENWPWLDSPLPDEELPPIGSLGVNLKAYGLKSWKDLYNERQKLSLITFLDCIKRNREEIIEDCAKYENKDELSKAILGYLTLILGRLADKNATLVVYNAYGEKIEHVFGRTALPIKWDFAELNVFSGGNGDWGSNISWVTRFIKTHSWTIKHPVRITQGSATSLPYEDEFFDAIITDPPYYDNVPYSDLSDFFYVWFKRSIGDLFPNLFATPLTPKSQEIVANKGRQENPEEFFETTLFKAFKEMYRTLKSNGIAVIVYAHKSTTGWETMLNALMKTGFIVTASWPIQTERKGRLRAKTSAALASSIYIVCRKYKKLKPTYINEIKPFIQDQIIMKLKMFWNQEIYGGDFFISAIGPAMEIYSKYESVESYSGDKFTIDELLNFVRTTTTSFLIQKLLKSKERIEIDNASQFYLSFRWFFLDKTVDFSDVQNLATSCGINLEDFWSRDSFVKKTGANITVLPAHNRSKIDAENSFVDIMHKAQKLWQSEKFDDLEDLLVRTKTLDNQIFWQFCQAIAECLIIGTREKQLLEGLLKGMARISKKTHKDDSQKLDKFLNQK